MDPRVDPVPIGKHKHIDGIKIPSVGDRTEHGVSIAQRIVWSSAQLSPAQMKVLHALASCGDWETGQHCYPRWQTLVARTGLSRATVARTLPQLTDPTQPGGAWIVVTGRRHRHSTTYDVCVDRLATAPPRAQQVSLRGSSTSRTP